MALRSPTYGWLIPRAGWFPLLGNAPKWLRELDFETWRLAESVGITYHRWLPGDPPPGNVLPAEKRRLLPMPTCYAKPWPNRLPLPLEYV